MILRGTAFMLEPGLVFSSPIKRPIKHGSTGMVSLAPVRSILSVTAYHDGLERLQTALGVVLPATPRRVTADGIIFLWSGPASWLAVAGTDDLGFESYITEVAKGFASVTDQSDGRVIFRVHGAHARDALAKLVPIDLHPRVFAPDATALTLAGHITVQLWQADDGAYELACFRSFAEALYGALVEACREYEVQVFDRG
jgi:methylglutamate dehydrogenase subunit D